MTSPSPPPSAAASLRPPRIHHPASLNPPNSDAQCWSACRARQGSARTGAEAHFECVEHRTTAMTPSCAESGGLGPLHRIALLNRGEPAVRFLRAVRDYNLERETALQVVAFYTDPDVGAPFHRMADDSVHLGPALRPAANGTGLVSAYCHHDHVLALLLAHRCDAVWPGWGFVSEDADFVEKLEAAGITFLGPSAAAMRLLGDKIASKRLATASGVPMGPWHEIEAGETAATTLDAAIRIGFPLMVKASGGGGGRGIRRVDGPDGLGEAVAAVRDEVRKVFGQGGVFLEGCVTGARHIEVQLVGGADGEATAVGVRDCSIQRRNQKVIEEAPSPVLPAAIADTLLAASVRMCRAAGYRGVATAEFLYQPATGQVCFLEVNSRLQVEHTVTELVAGLDLVQAQIDIARGLAWQATATADDAPDRTRPRGHAIEVRLNAENPERGFAPSPGVVRVLRMPSGPGIRVDSGVTEGMTIAPEFDSMIAKVIAWAPTRRQAIARLSRALRELQVVVEDGAVNKAFLLELLAHPEFVAGTADTGWLDRAMAAGTLAPPTRVAEALQTAAIVAWQQQRHADVQRFFAEVQGGIPQHLPPPEGARIELRLRGRRHVLLVHGVGPNRFLVGSDAVHTEVTFETTGNHSAVLHANGGRHDVLFAWGRTGITVDVDGTLHTIERASGGVVRAPSPAMVVQVAVKEGDSIAVGDRLCTLEAMKLEMPLHAQEAGVVRTVLCRVNQQVGVGQALLVLEPAASDCDMQPEVRELSHATQAPQPRPLDQLLVAGTLRPERLDRLEPEAAAEVVADLIGSLRALLHGFEVPASFAVLLEPLLRQEFDFSRLQHPGRWADVAGLLADFAASESLFDRNLLPQGNEAVAVSAEIAFYEFCRRHHEGESAAQPEFRSLLLRALQAYGVRTLEPSDALREALWRLAVAHHHAALRHRLCSSILRVIMGMSEAGVAPPVLPLPGDGLREVLDRVAQVARPEFAVVADNARQAAYVLFEQSRYVERRAVVEALVARTAQVLDSALPATAEAHAAIALLVRSLHPLFPMLVQQVAPERPAAAGLLEALLRRLYADGDCRFETPLPSPETPDVPSASVTVHATVTLDGRATPLVAVVGQGAAAKATLALAVQAAATRGEPTTAIVEVVLYGGLGLGMAELEAAVQALDCPPASVQRLTVAWHPQAGDPGQPNLGSGIRCRTWLPAVAADGQARLAESTVLRDIHPETARRIELWRLCDFDLERLDAPEQIVAFRGRARSNKDDERIFVYAEVRDAPEQSPAHGRDAHLWDFEQAWFEGLRVLREAQSRCDPRKRFHWNRMTFYIRPVFRLDARDVSRVAQRLEAPARGLGLEKVVLCGRVPDPVLGVRPAVFVIAKPGRHRLQVAERPVTAVPVHAMTPYEMKVVLARRLGCVYPYEIVRMIEGRTPGGLAPHPDMRNGRFAEYDLERPDASHLVPVQRPYGQNTAGVVVGVIVHYTTKYPDGMERVWLGSDPTLAMGAVAEPECRRIIGALDLAQERGLPVEWLPVSSGARIAMDSGTENLDWTARVLRRVIEFTERGGEINVLVTGVSVGAQSYWNAEATMLMHTRGILVMTPEGAMVLTGKKALEYSGSVAAEDERGIGGLDRIMGPNGQAQYFAKDLGEAYAILFDHYRFAYCRPGEPGPRTLPTLDPEDRSILDAPYHASHGETFATVGEIFDDRTNPGRKKPFAVREVMAAVIDQDGGRLERYRLMRDAETAVVWDAHLGGMPVSVIGFESRPQPRRGRIPMDGPDTWTGGTLFPKSSKKVARALHAASGVRPVVVLANLSGFDGSPESLRKLQLEYGAEIGRAVVQFRGPLVFVVIGRYHGGAYVVFSKALNPNLTALALEGTFASVIGGAPAAAVVFPREVRRRAEAQPAVVAAHGAIAAAAPGRRPRLRETYEALLADAVLEQQGEVAREFDAVHTVARAVAVGSLDAVIAPGRLRETLIERLRGRQAAALVPHSPEHRPVAAAVVAAARTGGVGLVAVP